MWSWPSTQHRDFSLLFSTSAWVLLRLGQRLNVPVQGWCGERTLDKLKSSTRPGLNPGHPSRQSETYWLCYPRTDSRPQNVKIFQKRFYKENCSPLSLSSPSISSCFKTSSMGSRKWRTNMLPSFSTDTRMFLDPWMYEFLSTRIWPPSHGNIVDRDPDACTKLSPTS